MAATNSNQAAGRLSDCRALPPAQGLSGRPGANGCVMAGDKGGYSAPRPGAASRDVPHGRKIWENGAQNPGEMETQAGNFTFLPLCSTVFFPFLNSFLFFLKHRFEKFEVRLLKMLHHCTTFNITIGYIYIKSWCSWWCSWWCSVVQLVVQQNGFFLDCTTQKNTINQILNFFKQNSKIIQLHHDFFMLNQSLTLKKRKSGAVVQLFCIKKSSIFHVRRIMKIKSLKTMHAI